MVLKFNFAIQYEKYLNQEMKDKYCFYRNTEITKSKNLKLLMGVKEEVMGREKFKITNFMYNAFNIAYN